MRLHIRVGVSSTGVEVLGGRKTRWGRSSHWGGVEAVVVGSDCWALYSCWVGCGGLYRLGCRGSLALVNGGEACGASADGACVDGACAGGAFADGACVDGACADGACTDRACADGACTGGACRDKACADGACVGCGSVT